MPKKNSYTYLKTKYKIYSTKKFNTIQRIYTSPAEFEAKARAEPYETIYRFLDKTFKAADELILQLFPDMCKSAERCKWCCFYLLKQNESNGHTRINASALFQQVNQYYPEVLDFVFEVVTNDELFYYDADSKWVSVAWTYNDEKNIAEHILYRLNNPIAPLDINPEKYRRNNDIELTNEQMSMLELVKNNRVCMLNGSGGSGKSQTLKSILDMLDDCGKSYACVAPTGIAAKVMRQYTNRPASTIHMFLLNSWHPNYIIIDELSMVGVGLLSTLLTVIGKSTNLIFIGDKAQLASISCGSLLRDISSCPILPRVELTKIFRYNTSGIITIATDMRQGVGNNLAKDFEDYQFIATDNTPIRQVIEVYDTLLKRGYTMDDILVLCPFNKHIGSDEINRQISDKYNTNKPISDKSNVKLGDKVINIKNSYGTTDNDFIANGDIGYLKAIDDNKYLVNFDFGSYWVESLLNLKQAYSTSIHRVQGSSARIIILLIDKSHDFFLTRNLLYTAVTRAREKLILIGDLDSIKVGLNVSEVDRRNTWLGELLSNERKCHRE